MAAGRGRAVRALSAGLALLLIAAACTDDDEPSPPDPTTSGAPGTIRLGIAGPLPVDPAAASLASPSDLMVADLLYDGLTRLDADGVAQPALAAAWSANPAQTLFTFEIDPDATFSSGAAVTSAQVIASLERVIASGDTSLAALSLEPVAGFRAFVDGKAEHVTGLVAADEQTVTIALTTPLSVLPVVLSNPVLSIVDPDSVEGDLASLDLTGSWEVVSSEDDVLSLTRREGAEGNLEGIDLHGYDDADGAYDAFEAGDVDWATVPAARYDDAVEAHGDGSFAPFHAELYFGLNASNANLKSEALRKAVRAAIDRDAIVDQVYPDLADPLATVVPAGIPGRDPERCPSCGYDPDSARDIVELAYPDGAPTIRIDFDESTAQQAMAERIAEDLDAVGIPTELRPLPLDDYKRFVVSGEQELFSFGWIGAYGSPDAYLAPLFGSAADDNLTDYRSEGVDDALARSRASADAAVRGRGWANVEAAVLDAAVVVPIAQFRTQVVVADRVQGLLHAADGTVDWAQVQLTG